MMQVKVQAPLESYPGMEIQFNTPQGMVMKAVIPQGVPPGGEFPVDVPAPPPAPTMMQIKVQAPQGSYPGMEVQFNTSQGVLKATIPQGVPPGGEFPIEIPAPQSQPQPALAGAGVVLNTPAHGAAAAQTYKYPVQILVPEEAALQAYEKLLMECSQMTVNHGWDMQCGYAQGSRSAAARDSARATFAMMSEAERCRVVGILIVDTDATKDALRIVVHVDPESKPRRKGSHYNAGSSSLLRGKPHGAHRTELRLGDGRVLLTLTSGGHGDRNSQPDAFVMDRGDPSGDITQVQASVKVLTVRHPNSADELLRQGFQLYQPYKLNTSDAYQCAMCALGVATCFIWFCFWEMPTTHFEMKVRTCVLGRR